MATIDLKLKSYDELSFEIMRLNTDNYLKQQEIDRLNNIIDELENVIVNFIERHTEDYLDWKYDEKIYLAESNILQKLFDTYYNKLKELKENK